MVSAEGPRRRRRPISERRRIVEEAFAPDASVARVAQLQLPKGRLRIEGEADPASPGVHCY